MRNVLPSLESISAFCCLLSHGTAQASTACLLPARLGNALSEAKSFWISHQEAHRYRSARQKTSTEKVETH